jgi:hypothetical protein
MPMLLILPYLNWEIQQQPITYDYPDQKQVWNGPKINIIFKAHHF